MRKFPIGARVRNTLDDSFATVCKPEYPPTGNVVPCVYDGEENCIYHTPAGNLELIEEDK